MCTEVETYSLTGLGGMGCRRLALGGGGGGGGQADSSLSRHKTHEKRNFDERPDWACLGGVKSGVIILICTRTLIVSLPPPPQS